MGLTLVPYPAGVVRLGLGDLREQRGACLAPHSGSGADLVVVPDPQEVVPDEPRVRQEEGNQRRHLGQADRNDGGHDERRGRPQ